MTRVVKNREKHGITGCALIASTPIVAAIEELRSQIANRKRFTPHCEVAAAMDMICRTFEHALRDAENSDVYITIDQVAKRLSRPTSTLSRICRDHGEEAGAYKVKGVWVIHWPTFEAFMKSTETKGTKEAA